MIHGVFTFQRETHTNKHVEVEGTGKDIVGSIVYIIDIVGSIKDIVKSLSQPKGIQQTQVSLRP